MECVYNKSRRIAEKALLCCVFGLFFASCATVYKEKFYSDVIGFNDSIMQSYMPSSKTPKETDILRPIPGSGTSNKNPYNLISSGDVNNIKDAISKIPSGQNTAALYALDIGLDRLTLINKKFMENDPSSRYYVIFFTDSLDNVSVDMALRTNRGKYPVGTPGRVAYGNAMQSRMKQVVKKYQFFKLSKKTSTTNVFQSYVFLMDGADLKSYPTNVLVSLYSPFIASQNAPTTEVIRGNDSTRLFDEFVKAFMGAYISSFSFSIPKDYVGQRIRMQLTQNVYFEGTLRLQMTNSFLFFKKPLYTLENITTSTGFAFDEGTKISMDAKTFNKRLNTVPFTINNLLLNNQSYYFSGEYVSQQHFDEIANQFIQNTEYTWELRNKKNSYVIFILDTSMSVEEYTIAKDTINRIIDYIVSQPE